MRTHKLSWKFLALAGVAVLLPAAIVYGHDDAIGTRFVAPDRRRRRRLRRQPPSLPHAHLRAHAGGAGRRDQARRGHLRCLRHRRRESADRQGRRARRLFRRRSLRHPERRDQPHACLGRGRRVPQQLHRAWLHVVDANGDPLPRIIMPKIAGAHCLRQRAARARFPATTSTISRRCSCRKFPARPRARARSGASSTSTTIASTRSSAIATARPSTT